MNTSPLAGSEHGLYRAFPEVEARDKSELSQTGSAQATESKEGSVALVCGSGLGSNLVPQHSYKYVLPELGTASSLCPEGRDSSQRDTPWFARHFPTFIALYHGLRTMARRQIVAPATDRTPDHSEEDPVNSQHGKTADGGSDRLEQHLPSKECDEKPIATYLTTRCYACSTSAAARESNEDFVAAGRIEVMGSEAVHFLVLADGMGGYHGGRTAAEIAVQTFASELARYMVAVAPSDGTQDVSAHIQKAFSTAQDTLTARARICPELAHMGTTLCASVMVGNRLYTANVGDTRAYLCRDGALTQLTRDDSLLQDLIDSGAMTSEEALNHPMDNVITKALAAGEHLDLPVVTEVTLHSAAVVFLCSDGFWKFAENTLPAQLNPLGTGEVTNERLRTTALSLVDTAVSLGSDDNVSVALLWVDNSNGK